MEKNKWLWITLIVLLVIFVGFVVWQMTAISVKPVKNQTTSTSSTPTEVEIATSTKNYANTKNNYTIDYPSNFIISSLDTKIPVATADSINFIPNGSQIPALIVQVSADPAQTVQAISDNLAKQKATKTDLTVANEKASKFMLANPMTGDIEEYIAFSHVNKTYLLSGNPKVVESIISTLKFTTK